MAAQTLDWTYEMPAAGDGATGLEDYVVEDARGGHAGKVGTVLRHEDRLFLAVEHGTPPLRNELVVIPWDAMHDVDHETLSVRVALDPDEFERAPRLDQSRKAEGSGADATRVTDIPGSPVQPAPATAPGPIDRPWSYTVPLGTGLLGVFATLVLMIFASGTDFVGWKYWLFVIPVGLIAFAGVAAYRLFRDPYVRR
jgi:hypothetical protein